MNRSGSTTPIHGFDQSGEPIRSNLSTASGIGTRNAIRRGGHVLLPELKPVVRRRRPSSESSVFSGRRNSTGSLKTINEGSTQSLEWDTDSSLPTFQEYPRIWSSSTYFDVSVNGDTLNSDRESDEEFLDTENFSGEGNSDSTNSGTTVISVDPSSVVETNMEIEEKKYVLIVKRCLMRVEDDISTLIIDETPLEYIRDRLSLAEQCKKDLQEADLYLSEYKESYSESELHKSLYSTKEDLKRFITSCHSKLKHAADTEKELDISNRSGSDHHSESIIRARSTKVKKNLDPLSDDIDEIVAQLKLLATEQPGSDAEILLMQDKFLALDKHAAELREDALTMSKDALESGLEEKVLVLEEKLRDLKVSRRMADTVVRSEKSKAGLGGGRTIGARAANLDLKPPVFRGDSQDKIDFYTFSAEFKDYAQAKHLSKNDELRVLQRTALDGPAKAACAGMLSLEPIWKFLKENYGNPAHLFSSKVDEIRRLGSCSGTDTKKRDWAVNVHAKLTALHTLCIKYDLVDDLFHSSLVYELRTALPAIVDKEFRAILQTKGNSFGIVKKETTFTEFLKFMESYVQQLTFDVNLELSSSSIPASKEAATSGKAVTPPVQSRNKPKKVYASTGPSQSQGSSQTQAAKPIKPNAGQKYKSPAEMVCGKCAHKHTHIFYCEHFLNSSVKDRWTITKDLMVCKRCLRMDSNLDINDIRKWWADHEVNCKTDFSCKAGKCSSKTPSYQTNIAMCTNHINDNKKDEAKFIQSLDKQKLPPSVQQGSIKLFYNIQQYLSANSSKQESQFKDGMELLPDIDDPGIFLMQLIKVDGYKLLTFYDSGCSGAAISDKAHAILETETMRPGPTMLDVAGGATIKLEHGDERFHLEIDSLQQKATITGLRMPSITSRFPLYELKEAWKELSNVFASKGGDVKTLPMVEDTIGGAEVDLMIGVRYRKYFPKLVFELPGGLGLYRAVFKSGTGNQGVLGGPHSAWRYALDSAQVMTSSVFFSREYKAYQVQQSWVRLNQHKFMLSADPTCSQTNLVEEETFNEQDFELCSFKHCDKHLSECGWILPCSWDLTYSKYNVREAEKLFNDVEDTGSSSPYRCVACRNCSKCRNGDQLEEISLKEELEQALIESSVELKPEVRRLEAKLPFIADPAQELKPNRHIAEKVLAAQLRIYEKHPEMREDTLRSHQKLLDRGHVSPISELTEDEKTRMESTPGTGYTIPWRTVYNESSLSTPCRLVFDASAKTPGGASLNSVLAKGQNRLARLQHLFIRFRRAKFAVTGDVSMAFNGSKLIPEHFKYQQYLWKENLLPSDETQTMVVKTLIYGVRSSGGQTQVAIETLADHFINNIQDHIKGAIVLKEEIYVDDILDSEETHEACLAVAEDIVAVLDMGSMKVKAFTFSGCEPSEEVSADGVSVGLAGYLWQPLQDTITLDIKDLCLEKGTRGKRPEPVQGDILSVLKGKFTRRIATGKIAGVFDPSGLLTPITSRFKLDLRGICLRNLDWDDKVPEELLPLWVENLSDIQELKFITFRRAVIHPEAVKPTLEIIVSVDASQDIAVAAVHARSSLKNGKFSCQLLSGRSKLVSGLTIPRAELKAATMGAVSGHIAKKNLGEYFESAIFISDSSICLYWLNQDERPLQVGVRNAVLEVRRFSTLNQWYHVDSADNVADIGTRRCSLTEVNEQSDWQNGRSWMSKPFSEMPIRTVQELTLSSEEKRLAALELKSKDILGYLVYSMSSKLQDRYAYSKYILDPCKYSWSKILRILATVIKYVTLSKPSYGKEAVQKKNPAIQLTEKDIQKAEHYYFLKTTSEVRTFSKHTDWKQNSTMIDGVLHYTGRILDDQGILSVENTMLDLSPLSFCKPIIDRYSPVAYAIMIHCHEKLTNHKNTLVTLRESLSHAYIIKGRDLAQEVRDSCVFCRRFKKKLLEVEMGKLNQNRFTIAPPFYFTQVDLMGPFIARCEHNHRSTVKVWGVVFKCPATAAVAVHAMTKCDTTAFIMAYTRFAARFGHPAKLFPDEGGQLLKACSEMEVSWIDVSSNLNAKHGVGVDFSPCPVGGHNVHGMVERSIREVKRLFQTVYGGLKLDIMSYETAFTWVANELNNLPICIGSKYKNLEHTDLITPSRLIFGHTNRRALSGCCSLGKPSLILQQMEDVFKAWWSTWRDEKLCDFIPQPNKWMKTSYEPRIGDIVVFLKQDQDQVMGEPIWRTGRIVQIENSTSDGKVRVVIIEYRNSGEQGFRTTRRSVRKIAIVHKEDQLELIDELNQAARASDKHLYMKNNLEYQHEAVKREVVKCMECKEARYCERHKQFFSFYSMKRKAEERSGH